MDCSRVCRKSFRVTGRPFDPSLMTSTLFAHCVLIKLRHRCLNISSGEEKSLTGTSSRGNGPLLSIEETFNLKYKMNKNLKTSSMKLLGSKIIDKLTQGQVKVKHID